MRPKQTASVIALRVFLALVVLASASLSTASTPILIEAEGFDDSGGWVIDPQFMDSMGSPYLLAHGLGKPVKDAITVVTIPETGTYHIRVRTKDWVAQWKAPGTPGRFQILVDGKALDTTFGTVGAKWHWQDGGLLRLPKGEVQLALHDLTGFEGRCDAIVLSNDPMYNPPNKDPEMAAFRRVCLGYSEKPQEAGEFDFVVSGGGIAGTCAAVSAARLGLRVALIQDRPVLGGNNSSEVRVWLHGTRNKQPWPRIGDLVAELEQRKRAHYGPGNTADLYEDDKKLAVVQREPNISLFLGHRANGVEMVGGRIRAVIAQEIRTGQRIRVGGGWFADCTGDACVGALAGADFDIQETDHMGPCNLWNVCECTDTNAINTDTTEEDKAVPFPRCPWALNLSDKPFPGRSKRKPDPNRLGGWYWESGFDRDSIEEMEYVRDWNFRAMYGAWDALKNVDKVFPNHKLNWSAHILGKRESRRLMGDVVLSLKDLKTDRQFSDGCVPTGWSNDIHHADSRYLTGFEGDAFISRAAFGDFPAHKQKRPFWIPYRSLYSRNIPNLLMAGRCISVEHAALGAVRVMRTCGCEGEVIGMAASLCHKHETTPRGVYENHFEELQDLMRTGTGRAPGRPIAGPDYGRSALQTPAVPEWLQAGDRNIARMATVTFTDTSATHIKSRLLINDGHSKLNDNSTRWVHRAELPHMVEFRWEEPVEIDAARILSGFNSGRAIIAPITDFTLQWHDGSKWQDVSPGINANHNTAWAATFATLRTERMRLRIDKTPGQVSRIWEVEFYKRAKIPN